MNNNSFERKIRTYTDLTIQSNQKLRDLFFLYNDFKNKGQFKLQKRIVSSGKQHYDFDLNAQEYFYQIPRHIHLERPDIQEQFHNSLLSILNQDIAIPKIQLTADEITKNIKKWMKNRSSPSQTKQTLSNYFKRHIASLKLKKFKLMQSLTSQSQNVRSKINLLDFEIVSMIKRRERLKCEDDFEKALQTVGERPRQQQQQRPSQDKVAEDQELCYSNISKQDVEVYLRLLISNNLSSRKMMKLIKRAKWVCQEFRYDIIKDAYEQLIQIKKRNVKQNYKDFKKIQDKYDEISMERHPQTPEIKFLCFELLENRKFNLGDDREFHSFQERFDQLPILPLIEDENLSLFHDSALFFLKDSAIQNIGLHALLFRINNIISLLYTHQAQLLNFTISDQPSDLYFYKDSNRITDLTALEENQLKSYLREEIKLKVEIQMVKQDWLKLLDFKPEQDNYQQITKKMLEGTYKDAQSELIIQFCGLNDEEATRKFISQISENIKNEASQKLFVIAENRPYIECSHMEISLELLNELFAKTKSKEYEIEIKKSIKPEHLKLLENLFEQLKPNQAILETRQLLDLLTMRDQRRKIINLLNAFRSIERRITYDLIAIMNCKIDKDLNMEQIISVSEQKNQQERFQQSKDSINLNFSKVIKKRNATISFIDSKKQLDQRFVHQIESDASLGRQSKIRYGDRDGKGNDVYVCEDKEIIYDIVMDDIQELENRLCKLASYYINKYEKINRIIKQQLVDRFNLLKFGWIYEQKFQSKKLELIQLHLKLYENTYDPLEAYRCAIKILNLIQKEPILDQESFNFIDSYEGNIEHLDGQMKVLKKLIEIQQQEDKYIQLKMENKKNILSQVDEKDFEKVYNEEKRLLTKQFTILEDNKNTNYETIQESKKSENPIYEMYMLEKNMDDVFAELSQTKIPKESNQDDGTQTQQAKKIPQHVQQMGQYLLHPETTINFEGHGHISNLFLCRYVMDEIENNVNQLLNDLPQKSILTVLQFQSVVYKHLNLNDISVGKIEDNLLDDYFNQIIGIEGFSDEVMNKLLEYQYIQTQSTHDTSKSTSKENNQEFKNSQHLLDYDLNTLDSILNHKRPNQINQYRELFLLCNLLEFLRLREECIQTEYETKIIHKVIKNQRKIHGIKVHKHQELYNKESLPFKSIQDDQYTNTKKSNILKSPFLIEIDNSIPLNFINYEDIFRYTLPDPLEEFRSILLYDKTNLELFKSESIQFSQRWDVLAHLSIELDILINHRTYVEVSYLDIDRIFQTTENFKKLKKNIEILQLPDQTKLKTRKNNLIQLVEKKFQEAQNNVSIQNNQNLNQQLLAAKKIKNFKFYLIRLLTQDLIKEVAHDVHKQQLYYVSRNISQLIKALPIKGFTISQEIIPEELEKKIYIDQKKNYVRQTIKNQKYLCGSQMNIINPFYIMGIEDIIRFMNENGEYKSINHIQKVDPTHILYIQSFYLSSIKQEKSECKPEQEYYISYLKRIYGFKKKFQISNWFLNSKQFPFTRILKYYLSLHTFLMTQIQKHVVVLESSELSTLILNILFIKEWSKSTQTQQLSNDSDPPKETFIKIKKKVNLQDLGINDENKALMAYEEKLLDQNSDQKLILHEAIDNIVLKMKNNQTLIDHFQSLNQELSYIQKYSIENSFILEELSKFYKVKTKLILKQLLLSIHDSLQTSLERDPNSQIANHYFEIYHSLFTKKVSNPLNLHHLNTQFYNFNEHPRNDKFPLCKEKEFNNFMKRDNSDSIQQILKCSPIHLKKYIFNLDKKYLETQAQQLEDFYISQQIPIFSKLKFISKSQPSIFIQQLNLINQFSNYEKRSISTNISNLDLMIHRFSQKKFNKQDIVPFESVNMQNTYIQKLYELFLSRQFLIQLKYPANYPIFSHEYLSYVNEIKKDLNLEVTSLKANASSTYDIIKMFLPKNEQKFVDIYQANKSHHELQYLVDAQIEKEIAQKQIYIELTGMGIKTMQDDLELLKTFKVVNENIAERYKLLAAKQKISQKMALGSKLILPRVKNNPCFSSQIQKDSKQDAMIPNQAKLAFLQAFVNRFRNKVSRVDLLSSGSGFVITINDLEDCVNYLHRSLYQFSEKELRARLETCQLIYDYQQQIIKQKDKQINQLELEVKKLKNLIEKNTDGIIIQKGNKLLYDFEAINRQLKDFGLYTQGIEDIVTKKIETQFQKTNQYLQQEKEMLKQQLDDFKNELLVLCKSEIRNNVRIMDKFIKNKMHEALQQSYDDYKDRQKPQQQNKVEESIEIGSQRQINPYQSRQRCAQDEDVIFDPYITTKWINKLRILYCVKIGSLKQKHQKEVTKLKNQLMNVEDISEKIKEQQKRENVLKKELVNLHENLSQQRKYNDELIQEVEGLQFEKKRYQKINEDLSYQIKSNKLSETRRYMSLESRDDSVHFPIIQKKPKTTKNKIKNNISFQD